MNLEDNTLKREKQEEQKRRRAIPGRQQRKSIPKAGQQKNRERNIVLYVSTNCKISRRIFIPVIVCWDILCPFVASKGAFI